MRAVTDFTFNSKTLDWGWKDFVARSELLRVDSGFLVNGKLMVSANVTVEKERVPLLAGGFSVGDEVVWNGPVRSIGNDHVERGMRGTVLGSKARAGFAHDFDLVVQFGSVGRSEPADGYIVVDEARLFSSTESEYTVFEMISDALHNLGSNVLLTALAGALLAYVVYSRRAAQPRAKQVRRPEDRRRRRQAGAAAEATQDEAQVETNKARAEVEAGKHKAAKAEAAALAAAEKADAATKARATAAAGKAARAAAAEKAEAAKAAAAEKATAKAVAKAAAEKAAAERAAAVEAANAVEELEKPPPLPVMSLASAQFDTGRRAVPESTIGGQTTCIVCFVNPKSHIAVPCGHQCACGDCAAKMNECPVCRNPAREWMQVRVA